MGLWYASASPTFAADGFIYVIMILRSPILHRRTIYGSQGHTNPGIASRSCLLLFSYSSQIHNEPKARAQGSVQL